MPKFTTNKTGSKPAKPHPDFPLFPHASGRWCKKVRGKFCYFGPWDDAQGALEKWLEQKDDLLAGRKPRAKSDELTLRELANSFLKVKTVRVNSGELSPVTLREYIRICRVVIDAFGKDRVVDDLDASDFEELRTELSSRLGAVALGVEITRIKTLFKYGYESHLLDRPVRYGPGFVKPSRKAVRKARRTNGSKMLEPHELKEIIEAARPTLRAMILLALNGGFGQNDCSCLTFSAVDFETGWIDFPRPKTEVDRRFPMWPETVFVIKEVIANRPTPKYPEDRDIIFLTRLGNRWTRSNGSGKKAWIDSVGREFGKLLHSLNLKRDQINFYSLRHIFRTVADECKDQPAIDYVMGHSDNSMASQYRERINDERLKAVTDYVHKWLFHQGDS